MQAAKDEFKVEMVKDVVGSVVNFITITGNRGIIRLEHMSEMEDMAVAGNIGHLDRAPDAGGGFS